MGLFGEISAAEMEEAVKAPTRIVFPKGTRVTVNVEKAENKGPGKSGYKYTELQLSCTRADTGESNKVWHNLSHSPKARPMAIRACNAFGLDPNGVSDESQFVGLQAEAVLTVTTDDKGRERNEIHYFIDPTREGSH